MNFLVQTINKKIVHDFSFTLIEDVRYNNWRNNDEVYKIRFVDGLLYHISESRARNVVPVGTVEFVSQFLERYYDKIPKPKNVPEQLFPYAGRQIINGTEKDIKTKSFVKSNDRIKGFAEITDSAPIGNYQISELVDIASEWRGFVFKGKLVGLQNYSGDFTLFPNVQRIKEMIDSYKDAPIAYTLDCWVNENGETFVMEVHDFFSCGLYGFADYKVYSTMLIRWFLEFVNN